MDRYATDVRTYYQHARRLGFVAVDCLRMAREAARMDQEARISRLPPPGAAAWESMPDGSDPIRLSFSIKVF